MNKKTLFAGLLAVLLSACSLTSCKPNNIEMTTPSETTASSSSNQQENEAVTANEFADRLEAALNLETQFFIDMSFLQRYPDCDPFAGFFVELQGDTSKDVNPCFSYAIYTDSSEADLLLFYDEGYLYRKDAEEQYKYPLSWEKAWEGIPLHAFRLLFGEDWKTLFNGAEIKVWDDGDLSAFAEIPLADYLDNAKEYLKYFGGTNHEQMKATDDLSPIELQVSLDSNGRMKGYYIGIEMELPDERGGVRPVIYSVSTTFRKTKDNFTPELPDAEEREKYAESEPDISEISLSEFVRRFSLSDKMSEKAVYTKMTTTANAIYSINGSEFNVPLWDITQVDLSNPKKPQISVVEEMDLLGLIQKTEIYYKDETYYYALGNEKYSVSYPADQYLANVEATAKEKAEAGISTFFVTDAMLSHAILTVNPDQTVSAVMYFNGETQRENIFHNIKSIYNDDFSSMDGVQISDACVSVVLNRYNYMTSYSLEVTVSANTGSGLTSMRYFIQYQLEYSEQPREIVFPEDLNFENYPLIASEIS